MDGKTRATLRQTTSGRNPQDDSDGSRSVESTPPEEPGKVPAPRVASPAVRLSREVLPARGECRAPEGDTMGDVPGDIHP